MTVDRRHLVGLTTATLALLTSAQGAAQTPELDPRLLSEVLVFDKIFASVVIVVAAVVVTRLWTGTLDKLGEQLAARRLLLKKVASLSRFGIYIVAAYFVIFGVVNPAQESLIAFAAGTVVVIGFAMKDLAGSIIAGVIILLDSPFQVGDRVQYGDTYGEVVEIGLRAVKINTLDDNLVSIPNNKFLTDVVASANAGELDMMVVLDFYIGVGDDHELARGILDEAIVTSPYVYLAKPVIVHVSDVPMGNGYATRMRGKFYVCDTRFESSIQTDITRRVKRAFRQVGIRAPRLVWETSVHSSCQAEDG